MQAVIDLTLLALFLGFALGVCARWKPPPT